MTSARRRAEKTATRFNRDDTESSSFETGVLSLSADLRPGKLGAQNRDLRDGGADVRVACRRDLLLEICHVGGDAREPLEGGQLTLRQELLQVGLDLDRGHGGDLGLRAPLTHRGATLNRLPDPHAWLPEWTFRALQRRLGGHGRRHWPWRHVRRLPRGLAGRPRRHGRRLPGDGSVAGTARRAEADRAGAGRGRSLSLALPEGAATRGLP